MILLELFLVFAMIGLFTIGGGYAMIPLMEQEVIGRGWCDLTTFNNMISISESTPGPFAINMATFIGYRMSGVLGAIVSTLGVILPSFIIILLIATVLTKFIENKYVKAVLYGFKSVVIGLIFSVGFYFLYNAIYGSYGYVNVYSIIIFIVIAILSHLFRFIKKKPLSPYILIILGAFSGALVYLFINIFSV